jgi:hypothetical protein
MRPGLPNEVVAGRGRPEMTDVRGDLGIGRKAGHRPGCTTYKQTHESSSFSEGGPSRPGEDPVANYYSPHIPVHPFAATPSGRASRRLPEEVVVANAEQAESGAEDHPIRRRQVVHVQQGLLSTRPNHELRSLKDRSPPRRGLPRP